MKTSLKIGVIVDQLLAGGVQLSAIEQVKELRRLGYQAKLIFLMRKKYATDFSYLVGDIPHEFLSDKYPRFLQSTFKFPIFSFFSTLHLISPLLAPWVIHKGDYDILVSLGSTTCVTTQAIFRRRHIPYIAVIHDPIVYILEKCYSQTKLRYIFPVLKPLAKYFEGSFVKDASEVLVISQVHLTYLQNQYKITPKIITFGTTSLVRLPRKRGTNLLSFGRWDMGKQPIFLLELVKSMPGVKLVIAGNWIDPKERALFEEKIIEFDLRKRVWLIPQFSAQQLANLCRQARLFLHPHFEAFGLAALEAAGQGLPIIIPQKSGVTELFRHGKHGYFPTRVSITEYSRYVKLLLRSPRRAYTMGKAAWKLVKSKYSWASHTQELLRIIQVVLKQKTKPTIAVLETGHTLGTFLSGGDKLMEPMAQNLFPQYDFSIIVPAIGAKHWHDAHFPKQIIELPRNIFDARSSPVPVFLTYMIRIFQTTILLLTECRQVQIIYSSTNLLPDILPAYIARCIHPNSLWVARVHHLIPPPHERQGKFIVNIVSYLMQLLSTHLTKTRADITIALNTTLKQKLLDKGFLLSRLNVLGAGINCSAIVSQKVLPKTPSFDAVYLGRLHPTKGIYDLVPIWNQVLKMIPGVTLAIIGQGNPNYNQQLTEKIRHFQLAQNVFILGFLPEARVYSILKRAEVFLFTDHEAGWGLAVAEAMAAGLPVVGYNIGVLGTVYQQGFRTVPLGNTGAFADEIVRLLRDPRERNRLAHEATVEAAGFDWVSTSQAFNRLLKRLMYQTII